MQSATEESDTWQDLPEFDASLEDPEIDEPVEVSLEISELEESDALDRDDSSAQDLDIGVELDPTLDSTADTSGQDLVLDIGQLLDTDEEGGGEPADDAAGPLGFDATGDVPAIDERVAAADEDLDADLEEDDLDEELPGMDADEEGDFGDDVSNLWSSSEFVADESVAPWALQRWQEVDQDFAIGALAAVTCAQGTVVAGGREIVWCKDGGSTRGAVEGGSVVSLALGGSGADCLLYATALGRLVRRRAGGSAEGCDDWRVASSLSPSRAVSLELSQPSASAPDTVLLRTSAGQLLCSEDFGSTFFALPAPGSVVALSRQADPPRVLVESSSGLLLAEVDVRRRALQLVPLDRAAAIVGRGQAPRLCTLGSFVAIADEARGVAVSYDAGKRFALVPGTSNASAWAAGGYGGAPSLWLSVLEESTSRSFILRIAAGAAERIAELRAPPGKDLEESSDNVRVSALCWEPERARLWVVGGFGIVSWCLPKTGNE
jgi:hypothetical protein